MKKLGIVLPTFNRCTFAKDCVDNLLPQLLWNKENTCLLITDNSSPDDTEVFLRPYSEQYPDLIKYVRQKENIGPHANFYYGVNNIDAEYVFLLGDDDIIAPNFISTILMLINIYKGVGLMHFNHIVISPNQKEIFLYQFKFNLKSLIRKYSSGAEFIEEYLTTPSFMSSIVFRKECMLDGFKHNYHEECYGYDWLLCLYYGILNYSCIYYPFPLVIQRSGEIYERYALNTILGQQRIFDYMSKYIPNIDNYWKKDIYTNKNREILRVIGTIPQFKDFYAQYYEELKSCLYSRMHQRLLYVAIFFPKSLALLIMGIAKLFTMFLYRRSF